MQLNDEINGIFTKIFEGQTDSDEYKKAAECLVKFFGKDDFESFSPEGDRAVYFDVRGHEGGGGTFSWEYDPKKEEDFLNCKETLEREKIEIKIELVKSNAPNAKEDDLAYRSEIRVYRLNDLAKACYLSQQARRGDIARDRRSRGFYIVMPTAADEWVLNFAGTYHDDEFNPYQILADSSYSKEALEKMAPVVRKWCETFFGEKWIGSVCIFNLQ